MTHWQIHEGDVLDQLRGMPDNTADAILCDPPYGLSDKRVHDVNNTLLDVFSNFVFPDFEEFYPSIAQEFDLSGITLDGSSLCRRQIRAVVKSGVGMPVSAVDLKRSGVFGEEEVEARDVAPSLGRSESVLSSKVEADGGQFLGDFILDFRDTVDFASRNILSSDFAEAGADFVTMPVSPVLFHPTCQALPAFDQRFAPGFGVFVGLGDDALGQAGAPPSVVTGSGAVNTFMLRFDLAGGSVEFIPTHRASQRDSVPLLPRPKLIGALPATSCLPSMFEPVRVRVVSDVADGAGSAYFHLWVRKGSLKKLRSTVPQKGFMGKSWDHGVPEPEVWREALRVAKPGAHLMAFGGTRMWHWLAVSIEQAGWEIRDTIMWCYLSGFPKAHDISKAIDKEAGAEREVVGYDDVAANRTPGTYDALGQSGFNGQSGRVTAPATDHARRFDGYKTALKPSFEPVIVAQAPLDGTYANNAVTHGVAGLNIDGSRIDYGDELSPTIARKKAGYKANSEKAAESTRKGRIKDRSRPEVRERIKRGEDEGRYPPNMILDPGAAELLDAQSGEFTSTDTPRHSNVSIGGTGSAYSGGDAFVSTSLYNDTGGASRMFYQPKASRAEREAGLFDRDTDTTDDGRDKAIDNAYQRGKTERQNTHPTVKPVDLARYLATLLLPPERDDDLRTLLTPYSGSGSEMIGAMLAGWDRLVGIEMNPEYIDIAQTRLTWWHEHGGNALDVDKAERKRRKYNADTGQVDLVDALGGDDE